MRATRPSGMPTDASCRPFDVIKRPLRIKVSIYRSPENICKGGGLCSGVIGARHRALLDGGKDLLHEGLREAAGDEDDAGLALAVWPCREFERRMKQALHRLHDYRTIAAGDVENSLHAQQILTMAKHQRIEPVGNVVPMQRLVELKDERANLGVVPIDIVMMAMRIAMIVGPMGDAMRLSIQPLRDIRDLGNGVIDVDGREIRQRRHIAQRRAMHAAPGLSRRSCASSAAKASRSRSVL